MLKVTENGVKCRVRSCTYYNQGWCALNIKAETDVITEECTEADNWYITGSFVLDKVFRQNTARDIDLVMLEGQKPKKLPDEVLKSSLIVELLWITGKEPHNLEYHNISLPKIANEGFINWNLAETLAATRILSVLLGVGRLPATTMFTTVKSIVKYGLNIDKKCFNIWSKSILNPVAWRALTLRLIRYTHLKRDAFDWDMVKAGHLTWYLDQAYREDAEYEKISYHRKSLEIMEQMDLGNDRGCLTFIRYVRALVAGDNEAQKAIKDLMRSYKG